MTVFSYPDSLPQFYKALGLEVSGACLVYANEEYNVASLWRDSKGLLVWRSLETGTIINNVTKWVQL